MSEAARSRRDDSRYAPHSGEAARDGAMPDPLAELARLVGQDDPYRAVFRPAVSQPPRLPAVDQSHDARYAVPAEGAGYHQEPAHHDPYAEGHGAEDHYADDAGHHYAGADEAHHPYEAHDDAYAATERAAYPDEAGLADERLAPDYAGDAALPDVWARGDDGMPAPAIHRDDAPAARAVRGRSAARSPVVVLAAVLLLTGGGLAATFLAKGTGSAGTATTARGAPTIMAAPGPTKVKADDGSASAPEDKDAALLSRGGAVAGPVKVVSSQEQPLDLNQLPRTADLAEGARPLPPAPTSSTPFPEAKKVKTFTVHPDGSMLSADGSPAPAPDAIARTAPRSSPTPTIASLTTDPADDGAAAAKPGRQSASPGARASAAAKPNDTADGTPAAAGGSYGLQLAASPTEADAQAAFAKLKKKFPAQLGAYTASVHKSDTGDKPVYRVRVGGLGQDAAKALCAQLQGAGGSCFVVHN